MGRSPITTDGSFFRSDIDSVFMDYYYDKNVDRAKRLGYILHLRLFIKCILFYYI